MGIVGSLILTGLIWALGGRLNDIPLLPDQGAAWHLWGLPKPTLWSRLATWGFYTLHQLLFWGIYYLWKAGERWVVEHLPEPDQRDRPVIQAPVD